MRKFKIIFCFLLILGVANAISYANNTGGPAKLPVILNKTE